MLTDEAIMFARMSSLCYEGRSGSELLTNIENEGFHLDLEQSTERILVFFHSQQRKIIFAFRGTTTVHMKDIKVELGVSCVPNTEYDWENTGAADYNIAVGICTERGNQLIPRVEKSLKHVQSVVRRQKYRKYDVYLTGHSLGGMIAMSIGVRHAFVKGGHVFNAGAGGREMLRLVGLSHDAYDKLSKKFLHHHILFDGISAAFSRGKLVVYRPAFRYITNPHSMNHFLPEKWYAW
jgi:hypothetical protein